MLDKLKIRKLMIFYIFSVIMDEISTLTLLKMGGTEGNPFVAWMIGISPLVWVLYDLIMFLAVYTFDIHNREKWGSKFFTAFWSFFVIYRLSLTIWNYNQIRLRLGIFTQLLL